MFVELVADASVSIKLMIEFLKTLSMSMLYFSATINTWESVFESIFESKVKENSYNISSLIMKKFSDSNKLVISLELLTVLENLSTLLSFNNLCEVSEKS